LEAYRIENLKFAYPNRSTPALDDISLTIEQGAFITLCGPSGCGKTTLLRHLKPSATPHGIRTGAIYFYHTHIESLDSRDAASKIGFVLQSPENQIVTDKVWHELAFGLESLGVKTPEIRLRVAEMASFFGLQSWFHKPVAELSGGQKQLLALASIMAMQPTTLILDEPTSQLDPIAAGEFLATIGKINRELGVTVILTEHRLEEALPLSSRVIVMENGSIIADGPPNKLGLSPNHGMFLAMPAPMRIWAAVETNPESDCPITVRDGANWLALMKEAEVPRQPAPDAKPPAGHIAVNLEEVWFKYKKDLPDIIKGMSFKARYGEITAMLGGNGTGKTTALSLIAGLNTAYRGKIHTDSAVYVLPQNPQSLFTAKTVKEDLLEILSGSKFSKKEKLCELATVSNLCRLNTEGLMDSHPYDLSGGEQQRAALAKILLLQPKILLLDEPTKGLDAEYKQIFAAILRKLTSAGASVIMVSHDIEFCAEYADRCALFFDGNIVTENTPREFFSGNSFYTTSANRMSRQLLPNAVTVQDVVQSLGGQMPPTPEVKCERSELQLLSSDYLCFPQGGIHRRSRRCDSIGPPGQFCEAKREGLCPTERNGTKNETPLLPKPPKHQKQTLNKRTIAAALMILFTIPLTIYMGIFFFDDRRFYFISMLIIFQTMLPFALVFESRKPQARELVVIAVLCAIAVAGRSAFFMLPQFKPVVAMVIIAGVAFGGETGFLVGAVTGFVSNMFFGQGPWTPWQMFAFGIIGFLAGILFCKGLLGRTRLSLCIFGWFATFIIYGGIMNPAAVIMFQPNPTIGMFLAAYLQGIPFDFIHSVATVLFLLVISKPMLEKLDRIKVKYGLVQ